MAQDLSSTEGRILENEKVLGEAMIHRDVATLSRLVADDWTIQSEGGTTGTKSGFIGDVSSGRLVVSVFRLHDMHVRVFGDVAVCRERMMKSALTRERRVTGHITGLMSG